MEVTTGNAIPQPSGLENILKTLELVADHHDPNTDTVYDLDKLAHNAAALSPQGSTLEKLLAAAFKYGPAVAELIQSLRGHAKVLEPIVPPTVTVPSSPTAGAPGVPPTNTGYQGYPTPGYGSQPTSAPPIPILVNGRWELPPVVNDPNVPPTPVFVNGRWEIPQQAGVPVPSTVFPYPPGYPNNAPVPQPSNQPTPGPNAGNVSGKLPDSLGLNVDKVFGPDRTGRGERTFKVDDQPVDGHYQMRMTDGTDSLDDQSGLIMAGIVEIAGKGAVQVEETPGAADKVYWKVTNIDTGEENVVKFSSPGVGLATKNEHATNWRVEEFVRTRGFNPKLGLHDKASGYDITFGVEGVGEAVPIRTPAVR